ncbi:nucleotidyltransferase family protein [Candidatus Woesearchaeota archaeon]|nr:nucleotidyltransferase family protein [Candidatus Woesearchaeota archaeon]
MKAIVLAAGYGTRLYPITKDNPKPLIKIAGKPIIEHILERIVEIPAVNEVVIVTNNKFFPKFGEWLGSYRSGLKIRLLNDLTNSNDDRLGAIGDIDFAVKAEGIDDDILVIAGDNLFEFSLLSMYRFFMQKKSSVVALYDLGDRSLLAGKLGVAQVDDEFRVVDFEEKPAIPKTSLASTACYFFTKGHLEELEGCIRQNHKPDNLGDFIKWLSSRSHVYGFVFSEKWFDIGSHDQLRDADIHWRAGK